MTLTTPNTDLLEQTLAAATKQESPGRPTILRERTEMPDAEQLLSRTHVDERGWLAEMIHPAWDGVGPLEYAYVTTINPGYAKGWGFHKRHSDRYFLLMGEAELILYDVRPESATSGQVTQVRLTETRRGLLLIPPFVWHATRNRGESEVVIVNFPTMAYDHDDPDKWTLPLDTPLIPFSFEGVPGW